MGTQRKTSTLSEISHLFLSSVRERQTQGTPRPRRTAPTAQSPIELTPQELAHVSDADESSAPVHRKAVPVTAVIAAHLNGRQFEFTRQYARHLVKSSGRVGLIELDACELRVTCFEPGGPVEAADAEAHLPECSDPRQMAQALEELNWDVEQWLLLVSNPRTPEARALLRQAGRWVLLCTCDHDGVVAAYRMLKGLGEAGPQRPPLALTTLNATNEEQAGRVFEKLSGVCRQFLDWKLDQEPSVIDVPQAAEHVALLYRPPHDKAQLAIAPQWTVVRDFLAAAQVDAEDEAPRSSTSPGAPGSQQGTKEREQGQSRGTSELRDSASAADGVVRWRTQETAPQDQPRLSIATAPALDGFDEVLDLPDEELSPQAILTAVLRQAAGELIECPLRPPMCPEARLVVARDRELVLLAACGTGLSDLRSIARAWRWLNENRNLIAMALPQFALDPQPACRLRLLVDHCDLSADLMGPLLENEHVSVCAYRKLRWGPRRGVFLEAA